MASNARTSRKNLGESSPRHSTTSWTSPTGGQMAKIPSTKHIRTRKMTTAVDVSTIASEDRASITIATDPTWLRLATPSAAMKTTAAAADTMETTSTMEDAQHKRGSAVATTTRP